LDRSQGGRRRIESKPAVPFVADQEPAVFVGPNGGDPAQANEALIPAIGGGKNKSKINEGTGDGGKDIRPSSGRAGQGGGLGNGFAAVETHATGHLQRAGGQKSVRAVEASR